MKNIIRWFLIYYIFGLILMNVFTLSRFLGSASILEIGPKIIMQNMLNPIFYGLTLVWPLYIGLNLYNFITGDFGGD